MNAREERVKIRVLRPFVLNIFIRWWFFIQKNVQVTYWICCK